MRTRMHRARYTSFMADMARRLLWFFFISSTIAYSVFLVAGSALLREAEADVLTVVVRDALSAGTHQLSGMVMVPSTCAQLIARTKQLDTHAYELVFETWMEPSIECMEESVPRRFDLILFAPATGVTIVASLDSEPLPLVIIPVTNS